MRGKKFLYPLQGPAALGLLGGDALGATVARASEDSGLAAQ
jgi:hypothetical protein